MKQNVYDFDQTIYRRDSTFDFYLFCIRRKPMVLMELPVLLGYSVLFTLKLYPKTEFKEKFYRFLRHLDAVDDLVEEFWMLHGEDMASFYLSQHRDDDIVISASPEFLLIPICKKLKIKKLIASKVDKLTGLYCGENCWGEEKLRRFREELPGVEIGEFYSDSLSDAPLAGMAERAFLVTKDGPEPWPGR